MASDSGLWAWTLAIAPPFTMEGRPAAALLDWVAAETGTTLRYADAETARHAAETVLHGSAEGLSPDQVPEVVLPSCGLLAERREGELLVSRLGDQGG